YWLATGRRFGAHKVNVENQAELALRFSVWAPNARKVEVVFAANTNPLNGYIADDGDGIDRTLGDNGAFPLVAGAGGIWRTDLPRFEDYFERPYMFRITNEQGQITYKTDIYSRNQAGRGRTDPGGAHFAGTFAQLDGTVSCSVVADPDQVT